MKRNNLICIFIFFIIAFSARTAFGQVQQSAIDQILIQSLFVQQPAPQQSMINRTAFVNPVRYNAPQYQYNGNNPPLPQIDKFIERVQNPNNATPVPFVCPVVKNPCLSLDCK